MRRKNNGLVKNEETVLATALALHKAGDEQFHGYALRELWDSKSGASSMNYATLYRCLGRLEERGLLSSNYDVEAGGGGPPRRMFQLTGKGITVATALSSGNGAVGDTAPA